MRKQAQSTQTQRDITSESTATLTEGQKQEAQAAYERIVKANLVDVNNIVCVGSGYCYVKDGDGTEKGESRATIWGRKLQNIEDEFGAYMKATHPNMYKAGKIAGIVYDSTMGLMGDAIGVTYIALREIERLVLPESVITGQEDAFKYVIKELYTVTTPEERYLYNKMLGAMGAASIAKSGITAAIGKVSQAKSMLKQGFVKGEMSKASYEATAKTLEKLHHTYSKEIYDKFPTVDKNIVNQNVEKTFKYATKELEKINAGDSVLKDLSISERASLKKILESQALENNARLIASFQTKKPFADAHLKAKDYGGKAEDYAKMSSSKYRLFGNVIIETHWVENIKTGARYEMKIKPIPIPMS